MCHTSHYWHRRNWWTDGRHEPIEHERIVAAPPTEPVRDPDLRVSQAERDEVAAELARHFADGRLTIEEYEERIEAALASRTGHDLEPLLADLPTASRREAPRQRTSARSRRHRGSGWSTARVIAIAAVVVLAISTGPWALWLLWPAFLFTGACGRIAAGTRHHARTAHRGPVATHRL